MYAPERHLRIVEEARKNGRVDVRDLAELLEVTPETIRRDLTSLERRGLVRRAHGGAIPVERITFHPGVSDRGGINTSEKMVIAQAAVDEIPENGSIIIDAGTSTILLAQMLPTDRGLTVVTHSLPVAMAVSSRPGIDLHLLGGSIRRDSLAGVGTWTHQLVGMVSVDLAFLSVGGITPERGLTTHNIAEAAVKSALIKAARRSILLADHTKFGREEFGRVAPIAAIDTIITDPDVNRDLVREVEGAGTEVFWPGRT